MMERDQLKAQLEQMRAQGADENALRAFVRQSSAPQATMSPEVKRGLAQELATLRQNGYGEEELRDYVRGYHEGMTSPGLNTSGQPFLQGVTLGYGDEIKGAIQSVLTGNSRLRETARARGQLARARGDRPIASTVMEVGGAVAPSLAGGVGIAGAIGRGATMAGRAGRAALAGAAEGGVYGSGQEVGGLDERAGGALPGAVVGGGVGALASPAADAIRFGWNRGRAMLSDGGGEAQASRVLRDTLERSNGNEVNIPARMRQAQQAGVPTTFGEQIGPQGVEILEGAAQSPGRGREQIVREIGERQRGQSERLVGGLQRHSGVTGGSVDTKLAARQVRSDAAGPLYDELRGIDLPDDLMNGFRQLLQSRGGRRAYQFAGEIAEQEGVRTGSGRLPDLDTLLKGGRLTVAEADRILQGFENAAQRQMTPGVVPGTQQNTPTSLAYNQTAKWLRDQMAARVPEFQKAREAWAGPSQLIEGVDLGKKALGAMDLDTFRTTWGKASSARQEGMRIGLINEVKRGLENFAAGPTADATQNLARRGAWREKLRIALGPDADDLLRQVDLESQGSENARQVLGNSSTDRRGATRNLIDGEPIDGSTFSVGGIIKRVLGKLDQAANERTREAIARFGLTTDPDEAAEIAARLLSSTAGRPRSGITGAAVGGPAGAFGASITDRNRR